MPKLLLSIVAIIFCITSYAQSFERIYGGANNDLARQVIKANDGGYFILSETESFGSGGRDLLLMKFDSFDALLWAKSIGTANDEVANNSSLIQLNDGGLIISGTTSLPLTDEAFAMLIKLDAFGNLIWSNRYEGSTIYEDGFAEVIERDNGELVVVGWGHTLTTNNQDMLFQRLDSDGNWIFGQTMGGLLKDQAFMIEEFSGTFLVGHSGRSEGPGTRGWGLMLMDEFFNIIWSKKYGGMADDAFFDMEVLDNGDIIGVGRTGSFGGSQKGLIVKFNNLGDIISSRTLNIGPLSERIIDVLVLSDGKYLVTIDSESSNEMIQVLFEADDSFLWARSYGSGTASYISWRGDHMQEITPLNVTTVGGFTQFVGAQSDIYHINFNIDDLPCDVEHVDIEIEEVLLETLEPNYFTSLGFQYINLPIDIIDVTLDINEIELCASDSCALEGFINLEDICLGEDANFEFVYTSGLATDYIYDWNLGSVNSSESSPTINFPGTGEQVIQLELMHELYSLCNQFYDTTLTVFPIPELSILIPDSICPESMAEFSVSYLEADSIIWFDGQFPDTIMTFIDGAQNVSAEIYLNGCSSLETELVTPLSIDSVQISGPLEACVGENVSFGIDTIAFDVLWNNGETDFVMDTIMNTEMEISIQVEDYCPYQQSLNIQPLTPPELDAIPEQTLCYGEELTLEAIGAPEFLWSNGSSTPIINFSAEDDTLLYVIGSNQCGSDTVFIPITIGGQIPNTIEEYYFEGEYNSEILIDLNLDYTYSLSNQTGLICSNCLSIPYFVTDNEELFLNYQDEFGCEIRSKVHIDFLPCSPFWVPNSISPNGDGQNDYFAPVAPFDCLVEYDLKIFDRWGQIVFESNDPEINWNGGQQNESGEYYQDNSIYIWQIEYRYAYSPEKDKIKGSIMLVR